jgi:DNA primase
MDIKIIDDLLAHVNIVDIIEHYLPLKKSGSNYKALCPFHDEKTPSFNVSERKQIFKCFGCDAGGTAIKFVQLYEKLSFMEAVRKVAEMSGYTLPQNLGSTKKKNSKYDLIYKVYELAKVYFTGNLNEYGEIAKKYMESRGFSPELIAKFDFGYALDSYSGLFNYLLKNNINREILQETGLFGSNERGVYDLFRDRLMIPIHSSSGRVVAFGGRKLDENKQGGKYINSPTTLIYTKGKEVFGLHLTKYEIGKKDFVLISEGYLDMLRLYDMGFTNSVASLGTALTNEQISLLGRYTQNFYIIYDGDDAGVKAAIKAASAVVRRGFISRIITLPKGEDPDSYLLKKGKSGMQVLIDQALTLTEFLKKEERLNISLSKKVSYLIDTAGNIPSDTERSVFLKDISETFGISYPAIISKFKNKIILENKDNSLDYLDERIYPEEMLLLKLMLENMEISEYILEKIDTSFFLKDDYREIFEVLSEQKEEKYQVPSYEMMLSPVAWAKLSEIMLMNTPEVDVDVLIRDLKLRKYRNDLDNLGKEIQNSGLTKELMSKYQETEKKVRQLSPSPDHKLLY